MRKTILLFSLILCLTGCAPSGSMERARELRPFPDPALGTDNQESETYKTQLLLAPVDLTPDAMAPHGQALTPPSNPAPQPAFDNRPTTTIPSPKQ
jgi:hypothetical protein